MIAEYQVRGLVEQLIAERNYPQTGIVKGALYWRWVDHRRNIRRSAVPPRLSEIEPSRWKDIFLVKEEIEAAHPDGLSCEDLVDVLSDARNAIEDLSEFYVDAFEASHTSNRVCELRGDRASDLADEIDALVIRAETCDPADVADIHAAALALDWEVP